MRKKLNEILKKNDDINEVERHFIYSYIQKFSLDYSNSEIFKYYFQDFIPDNELLKNILSIRIESIKELENLLELLIPLKDRKLNGAFFTPTYIVDFIINEISPEETDKNLDPSCGCGAFLIRLVEYYKSKYNKAVKQTIQENIFGADILEYNIRRTKLLLAIFGLHYNEIIEESDFNLLVIDSLKYKWTTQFHNVLGNPPYVKFQDLSDESRSFLENQWDTIDVGTFNLYFAFFELGYKVLIENGHLGYITPNNYFTSLAGESLRLYFQQNKSITKIVDFSHKKVFEAQTYTSLTFMKKQINETFLFDRIENHQKPEDFLNHLTGSLICTNSLNSKKWRLLKEDEQNNIKIIENIGKPIGQLFDICVGIATLKDELFFIDAKIEKNGFYIKETSQGRFEIEKEVTRSIYKISDFKNQDEAQRNTRRVICPYSIQNGIAQPIGEEIFNVKYPKCYEYFLSIKNDLLSRDKGKTKYDPFYVWGRTQGIARKGKKLVNPTFSRYPRFLLIDDEDAYFTNGYGTYFKEQKGGMADLFENSISQIENIDVVQKIFNSFVMHYYVSKTSVAIDGGYPCYQKNFIEKFSIPEFTKEEIQFLREVDVKEEIDKFLISKYHLCITDPNLSL